MQNFSTIGYYKISLIFSYYLMIIQISNPLKGYTIRWMDLFLKIKLIILKP